MRGDSNLSDSKTLRIQRSFLKKIEKFSEEYDKNVMDNKAVLYKNKNKEDNSIIKFIKNFLNIKLF